MEKLQPIHVERLKDVCSTILAGVLLVDLTKLVTT